MKNVTLTRVLDSTRKIQAIKALRDATRTPDGTTMRLREAKNVVDTFLPPSHYVDGGWDQPNGVSAEVEVYDTSYLDGIFSYAENTATDTELAGFILDLMCELRPEDARAVRAMPSFRSIASRVGL